jgi:anti-sigma factor RsiW
VNCNEIHPLLHAYVDSELDLVRSLEVERHLKTCVTCMAVKRSLQSLHSTLRHSDLSFQAPDALRARILRSVKATPDETAPRNSRPWMWQWLTLGAIGFAIVALMLQPVGISESNRLADEAISNHVRSLMPGHLMDVASTDQHTVKPWFNGKIDFAPDVKDFAAKGFPLIGGRLDYLNGQTVAALVYHRNQHTINVFVWPAKGKAINTTEDHRGYSVINQSVNGLRYCIVSDLNAKELGEFAKLFAE